MRDENDIRNDSIFEAAQSSDLKRFIDVPRR